MTEFDPEHCPRCRAWAEFHHPPDPVERAKALELPMAYGPHASVPPGLRCADCAIDNKACRVCVEASEESLERAYWRYDTLHSSHYRDANPNMVGPMSERDAFKGVVRFLLSTVKPAREATPTGSNSGDEKR